MTFGKYQRQGDVLLKRLNEEETKAYNLNECIHVENDAVEHGEKNNHYHRASGANIYMTKDGKMLIDTVKNPHTHLTHPEHIGQKIETGVFEKRKEIEYDYVMASKRDVED